MLEIFICLDLAAHLYAIHIHLCNNHSFYECSTEGEVYLNLMIINAMKKITGPYLSALCL